MSNKMFYFFVQIQHVIKDEENDYVIFWNYNKKWEI